jgi:Fic family protein
MDAKGYFALDEKSADLRQFFEAHPDVAETFERTYLITWLYHENALDGVVLTEEEIRLALEQHTVADPSTMNVLHLVRAHRKALARIEEEARAKRGKISVELAEELYRIFLEGGRPTPKEKAIWRKEIPLHRTYLHDLMEPEEIEKALQKWAKKLASAEFKEQHPIQQAAAAHWHFMQIFPFAEHNGRIGRLIQTYYLLRAGYLAPVMHATTRQAYYQSLRHSPSVLRDLLARSMEESLESCIRYVHSLGAKQAS